MTSFDNLLVLDKQLILMRLDGLCGQNIDIILELYQVGLRRLKENLSVSQKTTRSYDFVFVHNMTSGGQCVKILRI